MGNIWASTTAEPSVNIQQNQSVYRVATPPHPLGPNVIPSQSQVKLPSSTYISKPLLVHAPQVTSSADATPFKEMISLERQISRLDLKSDKQSTNPVKHPEHACAYCGLHDPKCVVFCEKTKKWFCNGNGNSPSSSHIITHLTQSRVKVALQLHKENPHGGIHLKCCKCACANVFQLGFCPTKPDSSQLLCRTTCSEQRDTNNLTSWKPIIEQQRFVSWLVGIPQNQTSTISVDQISRLEALWKVNPQASLRDLENPTKEAKLPPVRLRYRNFREYRETFVTLLRVEAAYDKELKESQKLENVKFRWMKDPNRNPIVYFPVPDPKEGIEIHVRPGEQLIIFLEGQPNNTSFGTGRVIDSPNETKEEIGVEITMMHSEPPSSASFTIQFEWKPVSYGRMETALNQVTVHGTDLLPPCIFHQLLGQTKNGDMLLHCDLPTHLSAPGLPKLNASQTFAVETVIQQRLSLIQGPPGTGKTMTAATVVYHMSKIYQKPVLAVAPSNIAVDQLCDRISKTGLKVTRVYARAREGLPSSSSSLPSRLMLHNQISKLDGYAELRRLRVARNKAGVLSKQEEARLRTLLWELEFKVLSTADVICCTCITAGDPRLRSFTFHSILIDEAAQATEPECLVPIALGCRQLVLIGDHCQLGPVVRCQKTVKTNLTQSLFERFAILEIPPIRLQVQYRMHPALSQFPNESFYEGTLLDGVSASDRCSNNDFPWPRVDAPVFFYRVSCDEELAANGMSRLNRGEAEAVSDLVAKMLKCGVPAKSIGVITAYEGQRAYILHQLRYRQLLDTKRYQESLEIANVDGFQGREKDYIILSCVRSNQSTSIGFLAEPRRLNVALTRARYGLIVVGNPETLSKNPVWNTLIHFYQDRNLLMEGSVDNWRSHVLQCKRPKKPFKLKQSRYYLTEA